MSVDNPPNNYFNGIGYNPSFYAKDSVALTKTDGDTYYLSKQNSDISTATLTTFNGQVNIKGDTTIGSPLTTGYLYCYKRLNIYDVNNPTTNFAQLYMIGGKDFIIAPNSIGDTASIWIKNSGGTPLSRLLVDDTKTQVTNILLLNDRLNFSVASYSFPFSSNTSLGYYLQTIGTSISTPTFVSNTPTTLVTIASVAIGVWRVDFSVKNTVGTAGAITAAQSFISITSANTNTPATGFTGSLVRSHVTENYGVGDIQIITSSMTLNLSAATNIYLTALRTYTTGAYTFIGEISLTRIA